MSEDQLVESSQNGFVTVVKVNRPKALNALNPNVLKELIQAFESIANDENCRAVLLTGAGDKAFVAGADIAAMQGLGVAGAREFCELGHRCMNLIAAQKVPVLAAVNGFALGGGLELALACDFIYASSNAKLGLPEVNLGLFPGFGGTQRLTHRVGIARAKEMVFSARVISAQQAAEWGLANRVCEAEKLEEESMKLLNEISSKAPLAVQQAKAVMDDGLNLPLSEALKKEEQVFPEIFTTEDTKEGVTAFLEKRPAQFQGK